MRRSPITGGRRAAARTSGGGGIGLALLSAATFGTSGSFADALLTTGWSPAAAVAARVGLAGAVLTPFAWVRARGHWHDLRHAAGSTVLFGLVAVAGCQFFFFQAVGHISVGIALLLEYLGTVLVVGWMWARHGQRPTRVTTLGGLVALAGLVLVLDLFGHQIIDPIGVLWGLAAAVGLAAYFVLSAAEHTAVPPLVTAWAGLVVGALTLIVLGAIGLLPMHAGTRPVVLAGHRTAWFVPLLGLALVAGAAAYVTGIAAARRLGATPAGFLGLGEVLFAVLFAWLLLGQAPGPAQLGGGALVVLGVALVRLGGLDRRPVPARPADAVPSG